MEPTAKGRSEKTFSYVVRAPSSDGFDVMNVDVKIDTSWVFQDVEDSGEEQGCLLEEAARRSPDVDTGTLRKQLESSEQKLLAAVDKYVMSESGLRSRVQELEVSERKLLRKVDQLNTRVCQERSASLRAQEQLEVLQGELASQDALGCVQDEWLLLPREEMLDACRSPRWPSPLHADSAPGPQASSGQPAEGPCAWGSVGAGPGPSVSVSGLETTAGLLGDLAGPDRGQPAPAEPSVHEQTVLLICGCPSGQYMDGSLLPMELAWISEQRPAAAPAQESFLVVQTSTLPPWEPAGDPAPLLLREASPGELRVQQALDAGPLPAPRAVAQPCWDHPLCQESPQISHHPFPRMGPRDLNDPWKEGGGTPEWSPEAWGARRTWGRKEEDVGDRSQPHQESHENRSLEDGVGAREGLQDKHSASGSQTTASCPWPRWELPLPLLWGEASVSMEGPKSLHRRRRAEEHFWGLLGGLSSEEEEGASPATFFRARGAKGPSPAKARLLAEQDGAAGRGQGKEEIHAWSGSTLLPLEESPGDEGPGEEEKLLYLEASSWGYGEVLEEPVPKEWEAKETLFLVEEGGLTLSPRLALSPEGAEPTRPPRAPRLGRDRSALTIDAFAKEMEACFQHLSILKRGSGGRAREASTLAGEDGSFAGGRPSGQEHAGPWRGLATCPAKEADPKESCEDVKPGEARALGTGQVLAGTEPDLEDSCPRPEGPSERDQNLCQPSRALERARRKFHQLVSGLKKERSRVLHNNVTLQRDQERCHQKIRALQTERERNVNKIATLERENAGLLGDLSRLKRELDQYLQIISDLEDCNGQSYSKISELEEDNDKLKGRLGQLQRAMSESTRRCKGLVQDVTRENRELRALISELGVSYKELIKDVVLGIEDMIGAFRGENAHLLRRIQVLEREVTLGMSAHVGRSGEAEEQLRGKRRVAVDKVDAVERAVQVTQFSEPLTTGVHGPPLGEEEGAAGGWTGPSSDTESSGCGAESAAPLVGRHADVSSALQGDIGGTGVKEAHLDKEEERPWRPADRRPAVRSLGSGPQLQGPEAEPSEEDLRLRVRQLRHQVLTLQCQLRDQGSAGRELQAARDEAFRLRDQLEGKVDELQKKQHEANLAVTPLKAKLASLVQKCRDRNHLLSHLLQELHRHGAASPLLSETVHSMVNDVALAEYAATFLAPGVPETSRHLVLEAEKTAVVRGPEMDSALPRPLLSGSCPVTEAEWPAQTAQLDSLELPLPSGPTPDLGPWPAAATAVSGLPVQRLPDRGGMSCPALQDDGLPPPSELLSPARILAFHKELGQSVRSNSRVNQSPLEL